MPSVIESRAKERELRDILGSSKPVCKMCTKVHEEMQRNGSSADEAGVREHLLEDRRQRMKRHAEAEWLKLIMPRNPDSEIPADSEEQTSSSPQDRDADDVVSICSVDIDGDDGLEYYKNSPEFFTAEAYASTTYRPGSGQNPTQPRFYHLSPRPFDTPGPHFLSPLLSGRNTTIHGTHPQCDMIRINCETVASGLIAYFKGLEAFYYVDYNISLRHDVEKLPEDGERWYDDSGAVFVEVANPHDDRWVFGRPDIPDHPDGANAVWVIEYVKWLRLRFQQTKPSLKLGALAWIKLGKDGTVDHSPEGRRKYFG